jgi:hypothetical protein
VFSTIRKRSSRSGSTLTVQSTQPRCCAQAAMRRGTLLFNARSQRLLPDLPHRPTRTLQGSIYISGRDIVRSELEVARESRARAIGRSSIVRRWGVPPRVNSASVRHPITEIKHAPRRTAAVLDDHISFRKVKMDQCVMYRAKLASPSTTNGGLSSR